MNLTDLHTFAMVGLSGSISGAAKRMSLPKSTVSRRVRRLEDSLGTELLRRSARAISLTQAGEALYQRTRPALLELENAEQAILQADSEPSGALRITTTPSFGQSREVIQCVRDFGVQYPKTSVDMVLTMRVVNLVEEGFDVGFRLHPTGELPGSALLMSRRLLNFKWAIYASPQYLSEMGEPSSPHELRGHRIALHSMVERIEAQWRRNGQAISPPLRFPAARWLVDDSSALERLALAGAGLVVLETMTGEPWVARGELVRVLPEYDKQAGTASLVWPASRHLAPRVRAFIDHAVLHLAE
ncbi:MAG: hypothetical protein CL940_07230 [Deltaproteobacteria bacterium]|nr:hypothetical protein [Deltaproteobacteria bacterium]